MSKKDDRKKAAEIIQNAMVSRSDSDKEKLSPEDAILVRMQQAKRDLERPSNPSKRRARKVRRMVPKGTRDALRQTQNYVKGAYTSAEDARRAFVNVDLTHPTREVGPGDMHNSDYNCHGKDTKSR